MRISHFTILLTLAILVVLGYILVPRIDVADQPRPRQGKTLNVWYSWQGASAKVVEQNVTSRIEGLVSAVRGVEGVESESYFGSGRVTIRLKKNADVSMAKFEIASLLRQVRKQLPNGVSYPVLSGGEVVNENESNKQDTQLLLSYRINSNLGDEQLREFVERQVAASIRQIEDVRRVEVNGGRSKYIAITYNPFVLGSYGLSANDIENGIRNFIGKSDVVGEVQQEGEKRTLYLTTERYDKPLEEMPIGYISSVRGDHKDVVERKVVYLGDLATYEYKERVPGNYYRVNGLNTIYLNVYVSAEANKIALSRILKDRIADVEKSLRRGVFLTQTYDGAEAKESELNKLLWRSSLSLFILLAFVWLVRRDWRYLLVMVVTLLANLALAVIAYCVFDIRLHIYSLAGITVSLGMVIDATVVMVDHYSYYHDRKAFLAILAALLTTIGSLIVVMWLPDVLQNDLYDFAWIIIINLSAALIVSWLFAPALIDCLGYGSRQQGRVKRLRLALGWSRCYTRYIRFTQKHKWVCYVLLILAFGIPFHLLPEKREGDDKQSSSGTSASVPWYERTYNATIGSSFFQMNCKEPLSKVFGGTMRLFSESLKDNTFNNTGERKKSLNIRAKMPLGGTAAQLNEKVIILENFLAGFQEIKRFETRVEGWGATINVDFKEEYEHTSFPYMQENKVIGKVISIGGADWSVSGVSERGFSNSIRLQFRGSRIEIAGYNYDRLYRIAEDMCDEMRKNNRVSDLVIETPGHERQEDELFMRYNKEKIALYGFNLAKAHRTLREVLSGRDIDRYRDAYFSSDIYLKSSWQDKFDVWHLRNSVLPSVGEGGWFLSDFMSIEKREAKNCIPRKNQEYVLRVAFNIVGSYNYVAYYIKRITDDFNQKIPVGYKCRDVSPNVYQDDGTQYWLLGLVVVIIFFVCSILLESLRLPLSIISLIPVSFIGTFLTYWASGVEFGTGGFASMVLLSGLTVNAGIYIVCEYRNQTAGGKTANPLKTYIRAYNHKIVAVFLTIFSTVLGLVPFFIDGEKEPFWFSFAVGSTGGLLFSVVALVAVMPVFLKLHRQTFQQKQP